MGCCVLREGCVGGVVERGSVVMLCAVPTAQKEGIVIRTLGVSQLWGVPWQSHDNSTTSALKRGNKMNTFEKSYFVKKVPLPAVLAGRGR